MLTNLLYVGKREMNKRNKFEDQESLKEQDRYGVTDAVWPAIVDAETFRLVQQKLSNNFNFTRSRKRDYMLTGVVKCGQCSRPLSGACTEKEEKSYPYYTHSRRHSTVGDGTKIRCIIERVSAEKLESLVIDRLKQLSRNKTILLELANQSKEKLAKLRPDSHSLLQNKKDELT